MRNMEVSKELQLEVQTTQSQLKTAIFDHQDIYLKLKESPNSVDLKQKLEESKQKIVEIGFKQKSLIQKLRAEWKQRRKEMKENLIKNVIEEKRSSLNNAINRVRKQNIIARSTSVTSISTSDDSVELPSGHTSPEPSSNPLNPQDMTQTDFLSYFSLGTHEVYKELQNKRAERKRRSTANPQFFYGNRGYDYSKRYKRNNYLVSNVSPPNTRQAVKNRNKMERLSPPPLITTINGADDLKKVVAAFPSIPNLPSGLTIERVSPNRSTPDPKQCIVCKQQGSLSICEMCFNGYHVSCHNRPLTQSPRHCPRCLPNKEVRTIGSLNVPTGMSVSYVSAADISDKLQEKKALVEKNKELTAELTQLQDQHSQLTIKLRNQKSKREEMIENQKMKEVKIKELVSFINKIKGTTNSSSDSNVTVEVKS